MSQVPLSQWLAAHQQCPKCHRACNVEHVGFDELGNVGPHAIALLYCEACDRGFEVLYQRGDGHWRRQFHLEHGPHNPKEFEKFKARLADVTVIAA